MNDPTGDPRDLVPVFNGSMGEVLSIQAALAARGIETVVKDEILKTIDPSILGGNIFDVTLCAPAESAEEVRAVLRSRRGEKP